MKTPMEKPILMCGEMVRATLEDRKTQTRRVVKPRVVPIIDECFRVNGKWCNYTSGYDLIELSPYGKVDAQLWVKETFALCTQVDGNGFPEDRPYIDFSKLPYNPKNKISADYIIFRSDGETEFADEDGGFAVRKDGSQSSYWKPSIFMRREYSRINLEIVSVRVERLQDISEADAIAEGCIMAGNLPKELPHKSGIGEVGWDSAIEWYSDLWEQINGVNSWEKNPWVWVIEFKRLTSPVKNA